MICRRALAAAELFMLRSVYLSHIRFANMVQLWAGSWAIFMFPRIVDEIYDVCTWRNSQYFHSQVQWIHLRERERGKGEKWAKETRTNLRFIFMFAVELWRRYRIVSGWLTTTMWLFFHQLAVQCTFNFHTQQATLNPVSGIKSTVYLMLNYVG